MHNHQDKGNYILGIDIYLYIYILYTLYIYHFWCVPIHTCRYETRHVMRYVVWSTDHTSTRRGIHIGVYVCGYMCVYVCMCESGLTLGV